VIEPFIRTLPDLGLRGVYRLIVELPIVCPLIPAYGSPTVTEF